MPAKMNPRFSFALSVSLILSSIGGSRTALAAHYAVTKTLQIGGEGGFDYATLDAGFRELIGFPG